MPIRFAGKPGLVAYFTVGDPDLKTSRSIALAAIDVGADVLELGVPFSDPISDGPINQRASERALRRTAHSQPTRLLDVLALAAEIRAERPQAGLIIFSSYNPILKFGLEPFCAAAAKAGVDGVLVTDMIVEEAGDHLALLERYNLAPVFLAAPTSPDARLERIAAASKGFVYAISRVGITGIQKAVASDAEELVTRLRRYTKLPIAVGFGISNAQHVAAVAEFADAAVVGTAIVQIIEQSTPEEAPGSVARFIQGLRTPVLQAR